MGGLFSRSSKKSKGSTAGSNGKSSNSGSSNNNNNSNQSKLTEKDKAVLDLKNARDKLKKFQKKLETESDQLTEKARELLRMQYKDRALLVLKLKKYKKERIDSIESQLFTVQEQIDTLDWAVINVQVLQAMRNGTDELTRLNNLMSMDKIDALMDETKEAFDTQNEISAAIIGLVGAPTAEEEAMLDELLGWDSSNPANKSSTAATATASNTNTSTTTSTIPVFPNAPTTLLFPTAPTGTNSDAKADITSKPERVAIAS